MGVVAWIVGLLLAAGFAMAGVAKIAGVAMMNETRDRLGLSDTLWRTIGGLEILGAIGVFIGLVDDGDVELLGTAAAIGLILTMIGALVYHVRTGDSIQDMMPAAVLLVLAVIYIIALAAR